MRPRRPSRTWFEYAERLHYLTDGTRLLCADGKGLLRADGKAAITDGTAANDKCVCAAGATCEGCPEPTSFTVTFSGVTLVTDCTYLGYQSYNCQYAYWMYASGSLGTHGLPKVAGCRYLLTEVITWNIYCGGDGCNDSPIGHSHFAVSIRFGGGLIYLDVGWWSGVNNSGEFFKGSVAVPGNCDITGLTVNNTNTNPPNFGYGGTATITANY